MVLDRIRMKLGNRFASCVGRADFHLRWVLISASNVRLDFPNPRKVRAAVTHAMLENFNPCAPCQSVPNVMLDSLQVTKINLPVTNVRLDFLKPREVRAAVTHAMLENFNPCAPCQIVPSAVLVTLQVTKINLPVTIALLDFPNPRKVRAAVTHAMLANFNPCAPC